jgi:hypothetical protein
MRIIVSIFFALSLIASLPSRADYTVAEYHRAKAAGLREWNVLRIYVTTFTSGIEWTNSYLEHAKNNRPIFCIPEKLGLNTDNVIKILDDEIARFSDTPDLINKQNIELLLVEGYVRTFPCK